MPSTRKILVRAALVLAVAGVCAVNFVGAKRREPMAARPQTSQAPRRQTAEGLVAVDAAAVLARVRRSRAQGVLVNAWATWCGPCKKELPDLLSVMHDFDGAIELLLVSMDEPGAEEEVVAALRRFGAPLPGGIVDEPLDAFKAAMNPRWPGMIPATFLFDRSGKLRYFWGGPVFKDEITPLLRRYLAGEPIDGEANFALSAGRVDR